MRKKTLATLGTVIVEVLIKDTVKSKIKLAGDIYVVRTDRLSFSET